MMTANKNIKNVMSTGIALLALVNLCNTGSLKSAIYSIKDNSMNVLSPLAKNYVDMNYVDSELTEKTNNLLNIKPISDSIDIYDKSGASQMLGKVFNPLINEYKDADINSVINSYGVTYDAESGQYVTTNNETSETTNDPAITVNE